MTPTASAATAASRRLMPVLFTGVFMAALDSAVLGPAIPALRSSFGVDNRQVGLLMSIFILFSLASTALMANLSDRHGRRPVYLGSVACFALGSLLVAVAPRFWMLVASRALQGIGAGGITPTASAVIGDELKPEERGRALGLLGATFGMAFVLGPPLAGLIMVISSWHWIFLVNLPIAGVVLFLGARALPSHPRGVAAQAAAPLDLCGIVVTFVMLTALVLGITGIADTLTGERLWPWMLAAFVASCGVLALVERRVARPMIPVYLFGNRQLAFTYFLATGAGFGMGAVVFLTSVASLGYGVAARNTGFVLLPMVVASMVGSMAAGRMLNALGARNVMLFGFGLLAAGYAASAVIGYGLWAFLLATIPVGFGVGIVVGGALRSIALEEAPAQVRGSAQGLINICTQAGTLLSSAAIGAVADYSGGGAAGFCDAYFVVALLMLAMLLATLGLKTRPRVAAASEAA